MACPPESEFDDNIILKEELKFDDLGSRNSSKNIKNLEEEKLEEKCKKEIEDIERDKEIKSDILNNEEKKEENNYKVRERNENLLIIKKTEESKELKKLYLIYFLTGLIIISLLLFFYIFDFFAKIQKGNIECTYFYPGNEIDILNPNYNYEKDFLQIFINDKEINKNEKYKSNNTDSFNVTIKLFSDSIDLSDMFSSQNVKTVIMRSQSSIKIKNMKNVFENCTFLENFEIDGFNSSQVKSMSKLFYNTKNLKKINISTLETSSLEDMDYMFAYTNLPEINLTQFDLEKILKSNDIFKDIKTSKVILNKRYENQKENLTKIYANINFEFQN
jgi:hypothetical protein